MTNEKKNYQLEPTERDLAIELYRRVSVVTGHVVAVAFALLAGGVLASPFILGAVWLLAWLLLPGLLLVNKAARATAHEYANGKYDESLAAIYDRHNPKA